MPKSSKPGAGSQSGRPKKPRKDFPLFPHATGRWAKKVKGKLHYFGKVDTDPKGVEALNLWLAQRDDLLAGRKPRVSTGGLTVKELVNRFLHAKRHLLDTRELSPRTFADYYATGVRVGQHFGLQRPVADLAADDFEAYRAAIGKDWGPATVANEVQRVRVIFNYAFQAGLIDRQVRTGPGFKRPSAKVLRLNRAAKGPRMFQPAELQAILNAASPAVKAMGLLGINCGFGNADVSSLPLSALDLERGWVDFPRPKTGIARRCHLWPETVEALKTAIAKRPKPKSPDAEPMVFVTRCGDRWQTVQVEIQDGDKAEVKAKTDDPVAKEFSKILRKLDLHRPGLGFYALRHTFETIGGEAKDQVAVDFIMGHARNDMGSVYREHISDNRLQAVADHVRGWLWPKADAGLAGESGGDIKPATE